MPSDRELAFELDDGTPIYRYPDGALRRASGAYYKRPPNATPFDKDRSALAHVRKSEIKRHREETYQGEVRRILKKRMKAPTPEQAAAKLTGEQIDIALDKEERAADRLASTKYVNQAAGMQHQAEGGGTTNILQMTPEAIDRMYALSMGIPKLPDVVVEGEVVADDASSEGTASDSSGGLEAE